MYLHEHGSERIIANMIRTSSEIVTKIYSLGQEEGLSVLCHCEERNEEAISFSVGRASCPSVPTDRRDSCPTNGDCFAAPTMAILLHSN